MIRRCFKAVFFVLVIAIVSFGYSTQLSVKTLGKNVLLMNATNSRVIYEKKGYELSYPASITKVAVALYLLDQHPQLLTQECTASQEALHTIKPDLKHGSQYIYPAYWLETDGSHFDLKVGEKLSMMVLLYGLLLESGNDAANVIAETIGGDITSFLKMLNQYIAQLGCRNTHFCNPHGLHDPKHVTTAYDMALIMQKALEIDVFRQIMKTQTTIRPKTAHQPSRTIEQHCPLIDPQNKAYYPYSLGGKTGFHQHAKNTLVAVSEKNNRRLIAVIMGCDTRNDRYTDAKNLFEAAFNEKQQRKIVFGKEQVFMKTIKEAKRPLVAGLQEDCSFLFYPSEKPTIKAYLQWYDLPMPIKKGSIVGEIRVLDEKKQLIITQHIYAQENVSMTFYYHLIYFIKKFF